MPEYFIPELVPRRWIVSLWAVISAAALWGLVCLYGEAEAGASFGVAAIYVAGLLARLLFRDFVLRFIPSTAGRVGSIVFARAASLAVTWGISALSGWYDAEAFPRLIPLLVLWGGVDWLGLTFLFRRPGPEEPETDEQPAVEAAAPEKREIIDRISVKKGPDIHIVRVDELLHVQAEGDYVLLFTPTGRFLKEQTMRWFEEHLPDHFVRIHRSCIVNIDQIARVELFGKENYHVRLKNGTVLKASIGGYRILKARLGL